MFSLGILLCFAGSVAFGIDAAVYLIPASGLFMSVMYPTINSKGISCFRKAEHGSVAGDHFGDPKYGFILSTAFALLLFPGSLVNAIYDPCQTLIASLGILDYRDMRAEGSA